MISLLGECMVYSYSMTRDRTWFGNGHQERVSHHGDAADLGAAAMRSLAESKSLVQDLGRGRLVEALVRMLLRSSSSPRVVGVSRLAEIVTTTPFEVVYREKLVERNAFAEAFELPTAEEMSRRIKAAFERCG